MYFTSSIGDAFRIPLEINDVCLVLLQTRRLTARRRGTPLSILGFRVGAGGLEGWPGRRWGVVSGQRGGAGVGGSAGVGWRLRGVQVEDELQALPKLHVKCLFATIVFSFDSSIQIPQ